MRLYIAYACGVKLRWERNHDDDHKEVMGLRHKLIQRVNVRVHIHNKFINADIWHSRVELDE